jgi:gliding motility-associated-like protein
MRHWVYAGPGIGVKTQALFIRSLLTSILLFLLAIGAAAQLCTLRGQTPSTAFPVCGTTTFYQVSVPYCFTKDLIVPGCNGNGGLYLDKNPFWYKFTCYQSGTLGFLIAPTDSSDDYDWQLYDITGHQPDDVFTDPSLIVTGNWAGTPGHTGASASGVGFIQCASMPDDSLNAFSTMPTLIAGHNYLLLVSHFTNSQSGYNLSFGGGTAVITDPLMPALKTVEASCSGNKIRVKLNKKIKCSSLALDGSDFVISSGNAAVVDVLGVGCLRNFDTDSIELKLDTLLTPGTHTLRVQQGTDGNTLLDHCDNPVAGSDQLSFTVLPRLFTPMDSLAPLSCQPQTLRLVFSKPILCSSIAGDGSDFSITGPYPIAVAGAKGSCTSGVTKEISIQLAQPLYQRGNFTLSLKAGSDGNTLLDELVPLDECRQQIPAGASLSFSVSDTVNAVFSYQKRYGCSTDTIRLLHPGGNGINSWQWSLDHQQSSTLQAPTGLYTVFGNKRISLVVSNGFCSDTSFQTVALDNVLTADFTAPDEQCIHEPVRFTSSAQGIALKHHWSFGDGSNSTLPAPEHVYTQPASSYLVTYTATDSIGCTKTAQKTIPIHGTCQPMVPTGFTPNGDGKNDRLRILNAFQVEKLGFRVFNRWGQQVFTTTDWKQGWDGTINGVLQPTGVFAWILTYTDRDTKATKTLKGTTALIR